MFQPYLLVSRLYLDYVAEGYLRGLGLANRADRSIALINSSLGVIFFGSTHL